jgi:hypothetical protein
MTMRAWTAATLGALALAGCTRPGAGLPQPPNDQGACWRMGVLAGANTKFTLVATQDANYESCAVHLEGLRLHEGHDITGAFEGRFIFAGATDITGSRAYNEDRFSIFAADRRQEIDNDLKVLMTRRAEDAKAKSAGKGAKP